MKNKQVVLLRAALIASCLLIIVAFFLPWTNIAVVNLSAFDFAMGAFSGGKPLLTQRLMFVFLVLPIVVAVFFIFENLNGVYHWLLYFISSIILILFILYYSTVSTGENGFIFTIIGALLLCATSIGLKISK